MSINLENTIRTRYSNFLLEHSRGLAALQSQFLATRQIGLKKISHRHTRLTNHAKTLRQRDIQVPFLSRGWLENFATGDIVKSLGEDYEVYRDRRCPRIPNGDFLLISRIREVQGIRNVFNEPSSISAEFEVPSDAWFLTDSDLECPLSILIEIALQPCGVLSAWLGTSLRYPAENYYFRNLDGTLERVNRSDLRGKTVLTQAKLSKTTFNGRIILQHFEFETFCDGEMILQGASSFGYFPAETMAGQAGLDSSTPSEPWGRKAANASKMVQIQPKSSNLSPGLPMGRLRMIDDVWVSLRGGKYGRGYGMASRQNAPKDWFYVNHFFQDPVMPGSLGLEGFLQAFKVLIHTLTGSEKPIVWAPGMAVDWKYRGQVLPSHEKMWVEVHLQDQQVTQHGLVFTGEGSLWADNIRIYEIKNLILEQIEGN